MSEGFKEYTIYKIECKDPEIKHLYVGSTEDYESRVYNHKNVCNNEKGKRYNMFIYRVIREYEGIDNWKFEILEKVVCTKADARKLEEEYRVKLKADLNSYKSYTDEKEYQRNYREEKEEKIKKYREENKEYLKEYLKEKKKVYKIREKERKMTELREKAKEYGDLSKFDKFPKP